VRALLSSLITDVLVCKYLNTQFPEFGFVYFIHAYTYCHLMVISVVTCISLAANECLKLGAEL